MADCGESATSAFVPLREFLVQLRDDVRAARSLLRFLNTAQPSSPSAQRSSSQSFRSSFHPSLFSCSTLSTVAVRSGPLAQAEDTNSSLPCRKPFASLSTFRHFATRESPGKPSSGSATRVLAGGAPQSSASNLRYCLLCWNSEAHVQWWPIGLCVLIMLGR